MKNWRRWMALGLTVILSVCALSGCGSGAEPLELSASVGGEPESLDPIYAVRQGDQTILMNLYQNLMRQETDETGTVTAVNGMAQEVAQEEGFDGTVTYTFQLREAKWSDGQPVTAQDFVYAWQRLADPASHSPYATLLSVVEGYQEAREKKDPTLLKVKAEDEQTLEVVLNGKYDWFLTQICTSPATLPVRQDVVEQETEEPWWTPEAALPTNGAYVIQDFDREALSIQVSETYGGTVSGPQIIRFRFADTEEEAWELYEDGEVDFVQNLPAEQVEGAIHRAPALGVYGVLPNTQEEGMDQALRQALNLAIDRSALAEAVGASTAPAEGLIPPGVPVSAERTFRSEAGPALEEPGEAAKALPEKFQWEGTLTYRYAKDPVNEAVAQELAKQWKKTLGLTVKLEPMDAKALTKALNQGDFQLAGVWIGACGNDAECFLRQWTSDHQQNRGGYQSSAYDTLLTVIADAEDPDARLACLRDAEALLLEDGAVLPLLTRETAWAVRGESSPIHRDPRGWFLFSNLEH